MTSITSASSLSSSRAIHGVTATSNSSLTYLYSLKLYKYQLLYTNVISQLAPFIKYFSAADYESLKTKLTHLEYNRLIYSSNKKRYNDDLVEATIDKFISDPAYTDAQFNNYVSASFLIIDGLWNSIPFSDNLINLKTENIYLTTNYKDVLEDPVKLQNYINERNINVVPFQASETFNTQIIIKPWFLVYLQTYGPPADGYFRSDYLSEIVTELINNGTITEAEFLNS
jgi:hypothetical protein